MRTANPFSIVCLHGPDRAKVEEQTGGTWDRIVEPKDDGRQTAAEIIRQNVATGLDTCNVNNHYGACPADHPAAAENPVVSLIVRRGR